MEGVAYRSGRGSALRRMHSEVHPRDAGQQARAGFWNTVLDRPHPSLQPGSFHTGFTPGVDASSSTVQPSQSFHGTSAVSGAPRAGLSRAPPGRRPGACPVCAAVFSSAKELAAHKEHHHARAQQHRPYQCPQCAVGFSQKSHLNQHVRTVHQKVRPHKCNICDKAFGKKYDLSSHIDAVHSNERPHACRYCDKKFAKRSNLTRHTEKLHPEHAVHKDRR